MNKALTVFVACVAVMGLMVLPALAAEAPVVTLDRVEVASIQPFFVKPLIKDKDGNPKEMTYGYSSTLNVAYVLNIKNPGKEPVQLSELQFTTAFDGFDVNTVTSYEGMWIPGGKTNQWRVIVTNEAFPTIVSLMVGAEHAARIAEMKSSAGALVSKWWNGISDFSFPVTVTNGTALFKDEKGKEIRTTFTGTWPKK
ncbi:MAG: hypothetical protein HY914_01110 [Desulfomonile tiedjei]|nr:hypothetical protein [Desulfomonile tiedjei]